MRRLLSYYLTFVVEEEDMTTLDPHNVLADIEAQIRALEGTEDCSADLAESQHRYTFYLEVEEDGLDLNEVDSALREVASTHAPRAVDLRLGGPDVLEEVD